jgi:hypothetical protein
MRGWHPQRILPNRFRSHTTRALWWTRSPRSRGSARADGSADFFNQRWLEYTGLSTEQARDWGWTVALTRTA